MTRRAGRGKGVRVPRMRLKRLPTSVRMQVLTRAVFTLWLILHIPVHILHEMHRVVQVKVRTAL